VTYSTLSLDWPGADVARVELLCAESGEGGVQWIARYIGRGKALEWIMLARHIDAFIKKRPPHFGTSLKGNE
jgi:hypothetical protein